jgi:DNA invertase Pin-like site-specific DNA recombinase
VSGKAVIYTRVSTKEQVDNTSLEQQENSCRDWCRQHEITVDRLFEEAGESAKTANRTEFQRMFTYLEEHHEGISHLVIDKYDRFSRNRDEGAAYRLKLRAWGITLASVKEPVDNTPTGNFVASLLQSVAQLDNDVRSERSVAGMKAVLASGGWPWLAPLGYLNGGSGQPSLVHDPERAPLMSALFAKVAEGSRLQHAIEWISIQGLRTRSGHVLSTSTASRLLRSPLYKGWVEHLSWGVSMEGTFAPIVTPQVWANVQQVLAGKAITAVPHINSNPAFPLKAIIICDKCGKPATASTSAGRANRYAYYHCHRGRGHLRIRADKAEQQFMRVLDSMRPNPVRMRLVEAVFHDVWDQRNASRQSETERLQAQLARLSSRKGRLLEQMQEGVLIGEDFRTLYDKANAAIMQTENALADVQGKELDVDIALKYLKHLLWNLNILFENSSLESKTKIARAIFPNGLRCANIGVGTAVTHSFYSMLADESVTAELLASPTGFEPVLSP